MLNIFEFITLYSLVSIVSSKNPLHIDTPDYGSRGEVEVGEVMGEEWDLIVA